MEERWNLHGVWHLVPPPARPAPSDLAFIEKYVKRLDRTSSKALILGCTPEYRDLLMKYRIKTLCADYHPESFHRFRKHMKQEDSSILFETDWREMEFDGEFDLILGDLAFNMLNFRDWNNVSGRMNRALKPEGNALQRIWLRIPGKYPDFNEIVREHKTRKKMHPFYSLCYPFSQHYVKSDGSFDCMTVTKVHLKSRYEEGLLTKKEFDFFNDFWGVFNTVMSFPTKEQADEIFSSHLKIDKIFYCKDWFKLGFPTYVMSKK